MIVMNSSLTQEYQLSELEPTQNDVIMMSCVYTVYTYLMMYGRLIRGGVAFRVQMVI